MDGGHFSEIPGNQRKIFSHQKNRDIINKKKFTISGNKKDELDIEKINTIEFAGNHKKSAVDGYNGVQKRLLYVKGEDDADSKGTYLNLLHDVENFERGFDGSNFDIQSMQGFVYGGLASGGKYSGQQYGYPGGRP